MPAGCSPSHDPRYVAPRCGARRRYVVQLPMDPQVDEAWPSIGAAPAPLTEEREGRCRLAAGHDGPHEVVAWSPALEGDPEAPHRQVLRFNA
jgi:hypothetical protein